MQSAFITAAPVRPATQHNFVSAKRVNVSPRIPTRAASPTPQWTMGKTAKFGPFTPAVLVAKVILGPKGLNKLRGKGISLHSQAITAFCEFTGAGPKMRQALIRQAKENGDTLGFLS